MVQGSRTQEVLNLQILIQLLLAGVQDILNFTGFYVYFKCVGLKAVINSTTDLMSTKYFKTIAAIKSVVISIPKRTADWQSHSKAFEMDFLENKYEIGRKKKDYSQVTWILRRLILVK